MRSGRIPIRIEEVDVATLTSRVVANLVEEGSRITVQGSGVVVHADSAALRRVIANVLSNALKYSEADTAITCRVEVAGDHGVILVIDHGRGIDDRDLDWIFNEFERGRMARDDIGTGLGLASARQFVRLQGGTIKIQSEVAVGTTVTIRLPLAPGHRP
jgi:signal transduction histidine kinase